MDFGDNFIHDNLSLKIFFGKLPSAVTPFPNNSQCFADPTMSGRKVNPDVYFPIEACHGKSISTKMLGQF